MKNLLIWGRGGHGTVVEEAAMLTGQFSVIEMNEGKDIWPAPTTIKWPKEEWVVHVAIGDNYQRENISKQLLNIGYSFATIIHPRAFVSPKAKVGQGCYIGPLASIQTHSILGNGVIINTNASVDHDCFINEYSHIAPGAHLCGTVYVGKRTLIAVGGVVVPKVKIGDDCILGASSALVETIEGNGLKMWGIPAKIIEKDNT